MAVIWSGAEWTVRTWPTPTTPGLRAGELAQSLDQVGVGGFADQQALRFIGEHQGGDARITPITTDAAPS